MAEISPLIGWSIWPNCAGGSSAIIRSSSRNWVSVSLTASVVRNAGRLADWCVATRASREGSGERDDKPSAHRRDRIVAAHRHPSPPPADHNAQSSPPFFSTLLAICGSFFSYIDL